MNKFTDNAVSELFDSYPAYARKTLLALRAIIYELAAQNSDIGELRECLKWNEPAYVVKGGSTIRINWRAAKNAMQFAVYVNCKTTLVETFKELYGDSFYYEGNRAIVFNDLADVPLDSLKHCISLALNYHRLKHLPLLGA